MQNLKIKVESDVENSDSSSGSNCWDNSDTSRMFYELDSVHEELIASNKYILHIDATCDSEPNIATALTDGWCQIYKLINNGMLSIAKLVGHKEKIIGCRFSKQDPNLIYTGSTRFITLWDIRTPEMSVINFIDTTVENDNFKTFNCFDVSPNERLLTAGTELFGGDAFLLFWDIRKRQLLGGYWESHTDDITQVQFHSENKDSLLSGSTDGLINVYDLSQPNEEDALIDSLNTQSSVDHLLWFKENGKDNISCITHTFDLQLWNLEKAAPYEHFTRSDIASLLKEKNEKHTYLAKVHGGINYLLLLAGSNSKEGKCLRSLHFQAGKPQPAYSFKNNRQLVRSSWFNHNVSNSISSNINWYHLEFQNIIHYGFCVCTNMQLSCLYAKRGNCLLYPKEVLGL
ncbi:hypothetical protein NQ315_014547 [Exocentrus adspersus]|uniref:WD repeat-containing protein 89 n=1 Tax=Exocentrus adspersus TaxID=1586481 RepID=A0AAV8VKT8_9CUCU|nr:hypothetical protein NQ315_014547 [Exocentrus adspersus]